jgi:hypothetical protein
MYGLRLTPGEPALYVTHDKAREVVRRLSFVASRGFYATVQSHTYRGEMKGHKIVILSEGGRHVVSEADNARFSG